MDKISDELIPMRNATTQRVRSGPKMSENAQFWGRMYFPTKYLCSYPQNHPKTPFWGTFQCKAYYTRSSPRKSHVNIAETYSYMYMYRQVLGGMGCVNIFPLGGVRGPQGSLMQIWDPHIISETTGARKLKLKTQLNVVKYSLQVQ